MSITRPVPPLLRRARVCIAAGLLPLLAAACADAPASSAGAAPDPAVADSLEALWHTVVEQDLERRELAPEEFVAGADTLRVITVMGEAITPLSRGVVVTNLLSGDTQVPLASVYAEPLRADSVSADTSLVAVEPGKLYLYVAQHRGLKSWRVTVQERRDPGAPRPGRIQS